jgi:hypothetical protein
MYEDIQEKFYKVISYSQGITHPKIGDLFDRWRVAKQYFIEKFGGLIWESPETVTFPLDIKDRDNKVENFVSNTVLYRYSNYALARFIEYEKEGFFDNVVSLEYRTDDGEIIPKGMKLVKAFKFFEKDEYNLDKLQTSASILIQENKIEGKLCISVHPLDFISCSENQYNWHSCHALDGEYRAGNLSYMVDTNTIICYIKGDKDVILPNFPGDVPWNNKKWRMWLYVADEHNALMAGRQYPFSIGGVLDYVRRALFQKLNFSEYRWSKWHHDILREYTFQDGTNETVSCNDLLVIGGKFIPRTELITDKSNLHYDDLLHSSYYTPWYCWRTTTNAPIHFTLGGEVKCLCCENHEINDHEHMVCDYCDEGSTYYRCAICGERIHPDDVYWVGDDPICPSCFDEHCVTCARCGEYMYLDDANYDEESGEYYCDSCWSYYHD